MRLISNPMGVPADCPHNEEDLESTAADRQAPERPDLDAMLLSMQGNLQARIPIGIS